VLSRSSLHPCRAFLAALLPAEKNRFVLLR
jgi:hypothetical protein